MAIDLCLLVQNHHNTQLLLFDPDVAIAGTNQGASRLQYVSGLRFFHADGTDFVQPASEHFRKVVRHMLHNEDSSGEIGRQLR
jgi:hypothetical protein